MKNISLFLGFLVIFFARFPFQVSGNEISKGENPYFLFKAVLENDFQKTKNLLDSGIDPNFALSDGETPLHLAMRNGRIKIGLLLLERGANPNARDISGVTPLDETRIFNQRKSMDLLKTWGRRKFIPVLSGIHPIDLFPSEHDVSNNSNSSPSVALVVKPEIFWLPPLKIALNSIKSEFFKARVGVILPSSSRFLIKKHLKSLHKEIQNLLNLVPFERKFNSKSFYGINLRNEINKFLKFNERNGVSGTIEIEPKLCPTK